MITIKCINDESTAGRFGNQLFKISTAIAYALDNNTELVLPQWHFSTLLKTPFNTLDETNTIFEDIHDDHNQFTIDLPKYKNLNISHLGYFQDLKYFHHRHNQIIERLELNEYYKNKFYELLELDIPNWKNLNLAFMHIRRGDYKGLEYILPMQQKSYYDTAINLIEYDKCIVFSDEIDWCKATFDYKNLTYLSYSDRYFDMFVMTLCKSGIIANSTYSWFGAYLNKNNPRIIKPSFWFSSITGNNTHSHSKIKLDNWVEV